MADNISGRYVDRRGIGVGGEPGRGVETIDRGDPAEYLAGRQRADTDQVGQGGAGVGNRGLDVSGCLCDAAVQLTYLSDPVGGKATQGSAGSIGCHTPSSPTATESSFTMRCTYPISHHHGQEPQENGVSRKGKSSY